MNVSKIIVIALVIMLLIYFLFIIGSENGPSDTKRTINDVIENNKPTIASKDKAWISFNIDSFNNIVTVTGTVGNQQEQQDILFNFTNYYSNKSIVHDIFINNSVSSTNFAQNLGLITAAVNEIQMANIYFSKSKIIIKGLAWDLKSEIHTITQLKNIFINEIEIINQLDIVNEEDIKIPKLEIKLPSLPNIDTSKVNELELNINSNRVV